MRPLRTFRLIFAILGFPLAVAAQPARVNGTVVNERLEPIQGATLRLTGTDSALTTGASGTFQFDGIFPSGMILTVSAPGYEFRSIALSPGSTVLTITMKSSITTLDRMIVRPTRFRIKGQVVDEKTGDPLLFARVALFPEGRTVEASNLGDFRFDTAAAGPVTIVAEAMEHLPVQVQLNPSRDTTIKIRMPIDSVAVRILGQQVTRLEKRSLANEFPVRSAGWEEIRREARSSVAEMVDRMLIRPFDHRKRRQMAAGDACVFFDDRKVAPGMLYGIYPEIVQRIEIYDKGEMIRVYSKRYVLSLTNREQLQKVIYIKSGLGRACE
jgi:hypothetical protein